MSNTIFIIFIATVILLIFYVAYKAYYTLPQLHLLFSMRRSYISRLKYPKPNSIVVFKDVNVVPMDRERVLENQTVIVENEKIAAIGDVDKLQIPVNAQIIDGKGKYLLPGLTDMHVHLSDENDLLLYVANGVTTIRNMWGFKVLRRDLHLEIKKSIDNGELLGPKLYTAGNFFDGKPPIWPMANKITSPQEAERAVLKEKEKGYDFIKIYSKLTKENYAAVLKAAKKYNIPAVGHVPSQVSIDHALEAKQCTIEHLLGYVDSYGRDSSSIPTHQYDYYAEKTKEKGVWNCPTIVVNQYVCPEEESNSISNTSKLKYISPYMRKYWKNVRKSQHRIIRRFKFQYPSKSNESRIKMLRSLNRAGAKIILGTDANMLNVLPGFSIFEELQNMVSAGMTPYEAIYAGTHAAAECLGNIQNSGTITKGKKADLILVKDNPLKDISNLMMRKGVMLRGVWLTEEKLKEMLMGLIK